MIDARLHRRRLLRYLAASPLSGSGLAFAQSPQRLPDPMIWAPRELGALTDSPSRALFQLYPTNEWRVGLAMALQRLTRTDKVAERSACHGMGLRSFVRRKPHFDGLDLAGINSTGATNLTWDFVKRLRDSVGTKILFKGILAREDAKLAVEHGIDGIVVSNHRDRSEDNGRSTIDVLPEILIAVDGRIPVLVDSGVRRGTDVVKALAMGAKAVCVGQPYLRGLGAFGQEGVERVLQFLRRELFAAMQQMGAPSLKDLVPAMVSRA